MKTIKTIFSGNEIHTKELFHAFDIGTVIVRVPKEVAYEFLLHNTSIIKNGKVYWFGITHRGLSVYDIEIHMFEKETRLFN